MNYLRIFGVHQLFAGNMVQAVSLPQQANSLHHAWCCLVSTEFAK